jgi:hypothetical protein
MEQRRPKIWDSSVCSFQKTAQSKQSPIGRTFTQSGHPGNHQEFDCARGRCYGHNFVRFSTVFGEKIGVCHKKTLVLSKFFENQQYFERKTPMLAEKARK